MKAPGTRRIWLAAGVFCCLLLFGYWCQQRDTPGLYEGKSAKAWVFQLCSAPDQAARVQASGFLQRLGPDGVIPLVELLNYHDSFSQELLWRAAPRLPLRIRRFVVSHLKPLDGIDRRTGAARALGLLGTNGTGAIKDLAVAMRDKNFSVRREAVMALGRMGPASVSVLTHSLRTAPMDIRPAIVWSLGENVPATESAVAELEHTFQAGDEELRRAAANALFKLGDLDFLVRELQDTSKEKRLAAAKILAGQYPAMKAPVLSLIALAADGDPSVRKQSVEILGGIPYRDDRILQVLTKAVHDSSPPVQIAAIEIWNPGIVSDSSHEELVELLKTACPTVRLAVMRALARAGKKPFVTTALP
jgi:hypothetical protein